MAGVQEIVAFASIWLGVLWDSAFCEDLQGAEAGAAPGEGDQRGGEEERGLQGVQAV